MTRIDEIRANLRRGIVGMPSDAVAVAQDLLDELDRTTADLAVAVEVARERGQATADLRAGIEALRDEWRAGRCACLTCTETRRRAAALDALLRGAK